MPEQTTHIDFSVFPREYHRLVEAWYKWRRRALNRQGMGLGRASIPNASPEYEYWLSNIPTMSGDELVIQIGDLTWYVTPKADGYRLYRRERNDRIPAAWMGLFADIEKYLYCQVGDRAFSGQLTRSPSYIWYQLGVADRVRLEPTDSEREYSSQYVFTQGGTEPRASLDLMEAVWFSHPMLMEYEQVVSAYENAFAGLGG